MLNSPPATLALGAATDSAAVGNAAVGNAVSSAKLKQLLLLIGRVNGLLKTRNQEVSLAWVYTLLKRMQAQGYFQQLKVRWHYALNFTGHAFLKLEYEAAGVGNEGGNVVLVLSSLGLGSLDGPLPLEMTQILHHLRRESGKEGIQSQGIVAFLELLSMRLFALYEQALAHGAMAPMLMQGSYPLIPFLRSLLGAGIPELTPMVAATSADPQVGEGVDRHYHMAMPVLNAALPLLVGMQQGSLEALRLLLNKLLQVPVVIQPHEFAMYSIPQTLRTRLNRRSCVLGGNMRLGSHYASFKRKFTLILGPMDFCKWQELQHDGYEADAATATVATAVTVPRIPALCTLALKQPLDFSVVYLLNTKSIPRLFLGHSKQALSATTAGAALGAKAEGRSVALGRGAVLRNQHTLPVLGLVRQAITQKVFVRGEDSKEERGTVMERSFLCR